MFPRWHVLFGALAAIILLFVYPEAGYFNIILFFLASFLIDFDHYVSAVMNSGHFNLKKIYRYYKIEGEKAQKERAKGIRKKADFHLFHTIEFLAVVGIIGIYFEPFLYIFFGMIFHSLLDVYSMVRDGYLYRREYFFTRWLIKKI